MLASARLHHQSKLIVCGRQRKLTSKIIANLTQTSRLTSITTMQTRVQLYWVLCFSKSTIWRRRLTNKKLSHILISQDDFPDEPACIRQTCPVCCVRGVENHTISAITATQTCNAIHPLIRVSATGLFIYRLWSNTYLERNAYGFRQSWIGRRN